MIRRLFLPPLCLLLVLSCVRIGQDKPSVVEDTSQLLSMNDNQEVALFRGEDSTLVFKALIKDPSKLRLNVVTNGDCANLEYDPVEGVGSLSVHCPNIDGDEPVVVEMAARYGDVFKTYVVGVRPKLMFIDVEDMYFESGEEEFRRVFSWVTANYYDYSLTVTSNDDWIVISGDQGTVTVLANETDDLRTGHVSVLDDSGHFSTSVLVSQEPAMRYKDGCVFFRDRRFKKAVLAAYDEDGDGELSFDEACRVRRLELSGLGIRDLTGIEEMKGIQYLDVSHNQIDSADFSDYQAFYDLRYIDVRDNPLSSPDAPLVNVGGCYHGPSFQLLQDKSAWKNEIKYYKCENPLEGKELVCLQEHSEGNGLYFYFLDRSLLDKDFENGAAREVFEAWMENIFSVEPFKSFRNCFSVYYFVASGLDTDRKGINYDKSLMVNKWSHFTTVVEVTSADCITNQFLREGTTSSASATWFNLNEYFFLNNVQWIMFDSSAVGWRSDFLHELGHAIGALGEEYSYHTFIGPNNSRTDDPDQVPWKAFLTLDKYKGRVGIFRRGNDDCFIPSPYGTGIMYGRKDFDYYNSPGRYAIFRTIYWCSHANISHLTKSTPSIDELGPSEEEMWKAFLEYDSINDDIPI